MTRNGVVVWVVILALVAGLAWTYRNSPILARFIGATGEGQDTQQHDLPGLYKGDHFSIRYPKNYSVDTAYTYTGLGSGRQISGVKFGIDPQLTEGTNLGSDTYLSVEEIPGASNSCSAEIYLDGAQNSHSEQVGERVYSVAESMGAAAGNRYEETVYATPMDGGCIAVRYFVHYSAIENYNPGAVRPFDKTELMREFEAIRASFSTSN